MYDAEAGHYNDAIETTKPPADTSNRDLGRIAKEKTRQPKPFIV
jgi:hypothetical protein